MDVHVEQPKIDFKPGGAYGRMDLRGYGLACENLVGAKFTTSNLEGMDLHGADLNYCDFSGANLWAVNLRDCNLYGINICGTRGIVGGIYRSDGYPFYAVLGWPELMIKAGCRWMSISDARSHWKRSLETPVILDCLEKLAVYRSE